MLGNDPVNWVDILGLKVLIKITPANDPGAAQMRQDLVGYLKTICDRSSVNGDVVSVPDDITGSATPKGCCCLQSLVKSGNTWTIEAKKMTAENGDWPRTTPDTDDGMQRLGGRPGSGTGGSVETPVQGGGSVWQSYDKNGKLQDAPNWRVLAHELCGHAFHMDKGTHDPRPQPKNNRPGHDQAIDAENAVAGEHPGQPERGSFNDPNRGESAFRPGSPQ
jgi:hypothetical protein